MDQISKPSDATPPAELLTVAQTAALLGVSRASLYRAVNAGRFPIEPVFVGSWMRFSRRRVIEWVNGGTKVPTARPDEPSARRTDQWSWLVDAPAPRPRRRSGPFRPL